MLHIFLVVTVKMVKIGIYLPKLSQTETGIRFLEHPV